MPHVKKGRFEGTPKVKCPICGYEGEGKYVLPGSRLIELVLWFMFIIPGLLYTNRRRRKSGYVCRDCGNENVVKK